MPRNGSGQYNLPYDWNDDKANGIKVLASRMQNQDQDIADALTASLTADGQTSYTGDQDFDGNKPINVADGADLQDLTTIGQAQTGELQYYGVSSTVPLGVAGVNYEVDATPTLPEYVDGLDFTFLAHATCLADPQLRAGTLAQLTLVKTDGAGGTTALVAGDIILNNVYECYYHSTIGSTKLLIRNPEISNNVVNNLKVKGKLTLTPSSVTISSGVIFSGTSPIAPQYTIDTESSAASDDLDTIGSTGAGDGQVIIIRSVDDARDVVVRHGTGNIYLNNEQNYTLATKYDLLVLKWDNSLLKWVEVCRNKQLRLGSYSTLVSGTSYLAAYDGFMMGYTSGTTLLTLLSDSSNPPTTARSKQEDDNFVSPGGTMCTVRKGEYYKYTGSGTVFFIPLLND